MWLRFDAVCSRDHESVRDECPSAELPCSGSGHRPHQGGQPWPLIGVGGTTAHDLSFYTEQMLGYPLFFVALLVVGV